MDANGRVRMNQTIRGKVQQSRIAGVPVWLSGQGSWVVPRVYGSRRGNWRARTGFQGLMYKVQS